MIDQADSLRKEMQEEPEKFPVYEYNPLQNHCREGLAIRGKDGILRDTFWSTNNDCELHRDELATAKFLFHISDFRDEKYQYNWEKFRPQDRRVITSQHGLQKRFLVRNGAVEDLDTMISNAEKCVENAECALGIAKSRLEFEKRQLSELIAQRP